MVFQLQALPWLALGIGIAGLAAGTRRLWVTRWLSSTPFMRPLRVRRWAKHGWVSAVTSVGLGSLVKPTAPLRVTGVTDDGIYALWTLPLGVTATDVLREGESLAAFFDAPRLDITPVRPTLIALTWRWDEPLAASRELDPPTPGTVCLADGLTIGRDESGSDVVWSPLAPASHALLVGGTRSGKSIALQVALAQAAAMPDVVVVGIDPTGLLLAPFSNGPQGARLALGTASNSLADALELLRQLVDVDLADRLERLRESRADAIRETSAAHPLVLVVLEEYPAFLAACAADDTGSGRKPQERLRTRAEMYVQRLLAEGLKAGIVVILAAQRADADVLGGYRRDQMSTRLAFRLESADGWRMVFPASPEVAEVGATLAPGEGYFASPGRAIARVRGDFIDYAAYRDHVEQAMAWRRDHLSEIPI
ncbi:FtsK/SpoIIIE domain-containing protein [Barrientosiimonas endolithica]|nr:FtsK/SpoIIIE domain-containing protein [Barrientosiimonas endolithica]